MADARKSKNNMSIRTSPSGVDIIKICSTPHKHRHTMNPQQLINLFTSLGLMSLSTHCIGYITKDSFKGGGIQYILLFKILHCKLLGTGKY